jgi:hypothetical protein
MITIGGMASLEINPPNHIRAAFSTDRTAKPTLILSQGFPADALSLAKAQNVTLVSYDRGQAQPLGQQWNLNIQRELPHGVVVEAGYFGNKFDHMWRLLEGNPAPAAAGDINSRREFTTTSIPGLDNPITLANVVRNQRDAYSRYHGLQAKVEKRYERGLSLLASYAWSKTIGVEDGVQNPLDWRSDRAVTSTNRPNYFVASAVYQLPFGRGKTFGSHWNGVADAILGGWNVAPIFTALSGPPLNMTVNGNPSNTGQDARSGPSDRPNVVGDWRLANPTVQQWFNVGAFAPNAPYTFGNAGKNILVGPGVFNFDAAVHKTFRITERVTAQLRLESFNVTNTPPLGVPNTVVGNPSFGQIASAGTPRDNQIGLKILF